jgi:hypothetical protein
MNAVREEAVGNADWQMSFASSHGEMKVRIAGDPGFDWGDNPDLIRPRVRNSLATAGRSAGHIAGVPDKYSVTWEEGRCGVGYQVTGIGISQTATIKIAQSLRWQAQPPKGLEYRVTLDGSESVVQPLDSAAEIPRFVETQGRVLTYRDGAVNNPEYAMAEVVGSGSMLWLSRYIGHEADGRPRAHLLDFVDVPVPDSRFRLDVEGCSSEQIEEKPQAVNGSAQEPDYIVAVVRFGESPSTRYQSVEVAAAWHADVAALKLVSLDPASVACVDEVVD